MSRAAELTEHQILALVCREDDGFVRAHRHAILSGLERKGLISLRMNSTAECGCWEWVGELTPVGEMRVDLLGLQLSVLAARAA